MANTGKTGAILSIMYLLSWLVLLPLSILSRAEGSAGGEDGTILYKLLPTNHQDRRGKFPDPGQIAFLHVGFSGVEESLLHGMYEFDSNIDNAMLDLSMYCEQHGYMYMRAVIARPEDRMWGYAKAQAIKEALQQVQLLVVCDFDVAIMDATQPIESILAGWGFTHTQLVMAAEDPDRLSNKWQSNETGTPTLKLNLNIGFMALRNHEKVLDSLELFSKCIDLIPGCDRHRWEGDFPDQSAWNIFILPTFLPQEILRAPCNEANGYSGSFKLGNDHCEGLIVTHAWNAKNQLASVIRTRLLRQTYKGTFSFLRNSFLIVK